jgi:hypothetical protein
VSIVNETRENNLLPFTYRDGDTLKEMQSPTVKPPSKNLNKTDG